MLDLKFIRQFPDLVKEGARKKRIAVDLERLLAVDTDARALQTEVDALATLQPHVLARIVRKAIAPFYDETLARRVAEARADWLTALDVNVVSAVMVVKAAHPHLVAGGGGAVVNFASISSNVAQTGRWLYPVSKAAIVQLTRNMAMDLAPDGSVYGIELLDANRQLLVVTNAASGATTEVALGA